MPTYTFTPPTVKQPIQPGHPLLGRFCLDVGQSVVRKDGTFQLMPYPWIGELQAAGDEGTDWFLGGRTYTVTEDTAGDLEAAGFEIASPPGFGRGHFGFGPFGG